MCLRACTWSFPHPEAKPQLGDILYIYVDDDLLVYEVIFDRMALDQVEVQHEVPPPNGFTSVDLDLLKKPRKITKRLPKSTFRKPFFCFSILSKPRRTTKENPHEGSFMFSFHLCSEEKSNMLRVSCQRVGQTKNMAREKKTKNTERHSQTINICGGSSSCAACTATVSNSRWPSFHAHGALIKPRRLRVGGVLLQNPIEQPICSSPKTCFLDEQKPLVLDQFVGL